MKPSQPPALASWMLRHLVLGNKTEALEGDLLEEFHRRRSPGWYGRQVLGAIVASVAGELRQHWKLLSLEAVLISAWTYYSLLLLQFIREQSGALAFEPHGRFFYWVLLHCSGILSLVLPLAIYLAVKRFNNFLPALCGLCAGIVVSQALGLLAFRLVLTSVNGWSMPWSLVLYGFLPVEAAGVLPYAAVHPWWRFLNVLVRQSAPLLFAIWAAQLWATRSQSTSLQNEGGIE